MSVSYLWSGRLTHNSARVKAKTTSGSTARLAVADNADMSGPAFYGPVASSQSMVTLDATGLDPNTQYWYRVEDNGTIDISKTGRFHTVGTPGEPYNLLIAASACAAGSTVPGNAGALAPTQISNHPVFLDIASYDPQVFIHMGDFSYYNLGSDRFGITGGQSLANCRHVWDDPIEYGPNQSALYRNQANLITWDDHDYGNNDSDGSNPTKDNAATVWRERVPCYDPASSNAAGDMGIYRSFQLGRVFFIVTDSRYYRDTPADPTPRTYMGAGQLSWFEDQLASPPDGTELVVWVTPQPVNSGGATSWGTAPEERAAIYQMIGDYGWVSPRKRFMAIAGDQHQFGWDSGANTAGFPLYTLCSLDSSSAGTVSGYDMGAQAGEGQYGLIQFTDFGRAMRVEVDGMVYHA